MKLNKINTEGVNDGFVMTIGIVFFGIVIPNATGLIEHAAAPLPKIVFTYLYFIFTAFVIWYGNRYIFFALQQKYGNISKPGLKIIFLLLANTFYTTLVTVLLIGGSFYIFQDGAVNWKKIEINIFVCAVCVIFVTQMYEAIFMAKQKETEQIKKEQMERAKAEAELEALKNQIDPHFIYNALNSLSYLIDSSPKDAKLFVESLAGVYRYILGNKDKTLVLLEDEILFLKKYISLLDIRFADALSVNFNPGTRLPNNYLIPPNSIFIAVENAVKHNELSTSTPLMVNIELKDNSIYVSNIINPKTSAQFSSKVGLKNLDERFKLIVGEGISAIAEEGRFVLGLPMLKLQN